MAFSSLEFLFIFLPAFLVLQCLLPCSNLLLVLLSLLFYFVGEGWYLAVVVFSLAVNYALGLGLDGIARPGLRRVAVGFGIALNLAGLMLFKYAGFLWSSVLGYAPQPWLMAIHQPLGISVLSFHGISYLVDVYRRDARAERSPLRLGLFMAMFPQVSAGPILRFAGIARQLRRRVVRARHIHFGLVLFCVGLGKKVLIADVLGPAVDARFASGASLSFADAWLGAVAYALQLLFDFSGYTDMALGLARMAGFTLPRNFDDPYASQSITEFWRRWHMSLSRWLREYLYIPLGGNRHGPLRTYCNLLIVFLACGLWHGANWTFVAWGAYHGVFLVIERLGFGRLLLRVPRLLRHAYALLVVVVGWVPFRATDMTQARSFLATMFHPSGLTGPWPAEWLTRGQALAFASAVLLCVPPISAALRHLFQVLPAPPLPVRGSRLSYACALLASVVVFGASAMNVLAGSYSSFIYFRF